MNNKVIDILQEKRRQANFSSYGNYDSKSKKELITFILDNWEELTSENPDYFHEEANKTNCFIQDKHSKIVKQKVVYQKKALCAFVQNTFEDLPIYYVISEEEVFEDLPQK